MIRLFSIFFLSHILHAQTPVPNPDLEEVIELEQPVCEDWLKIASYGRAGSFR